MEKRMQIPGDLSEKNGELKIDFEDSEAYWGEN